MTQQARDDFKTFKPSDVEKNAPEFVAERKKLMPAPERWEEFVTRMNKIEDGKDYVTDQQIRSIHAPTLVLGGATAILTIRPKNLWRSIGCFRRASSP